MTFPLKQYKRITTPTERNPFVADVQTYLTPKDFAYYGGFNDPVTRVHECTHGIQARIRIMEGSPLVDAFYVRDMRYRDGRSLSQVGQDVASHRAYHAWYRGGPRINAFYLFEGRYVLFNEPRIRKSDISPYIPADLRDHRLHDMYIAGQEAWEDTPLYVFDEGIAYSNGAMMGLQDSELEYALIFAFYCRAVIDCCMEMDHGYRADRVLGPFLKWNMERLAGAVSEFGTATHRSLLDRFQRETLS